MIKVSGNFLYFFRFDTESPDFFTSSVKSCIVDFILERQKYVDSSDAPFAVGINRMLAEELYSAAYPLHDVNSY